MEFEEWYKKHYLYEPIRENLIKHGKDDFDFNLSEIEEAYKGGQQEEKMVSDNLARSLEQLIKEAGSYCEDCDAIIFNIGNHKADHSLSKTGAVAEAKKALKEYKERITYG